MRYYLDRIGKGNLTGSLRHLKEKCFKHVDKIGKVIGNKFGLDFKPYWVSRSTLGAVLCDYVPDKKGMATIPSHKALFNLISEDFDYVLFSENIDRNLKIDGLEDKKILIINIERYEMFIKTFADKFARIKLFLYKKLTSEQEEIIDNWIYSRLEPLPKKETSSEELVEAMSKESPKKIAQTTDRLGNALEKKVIEKIKTYEAILNEFETKVNDPKVLELELRDLLHNNLWIIDFKYNEKRFHPEKEFKTDAGNIDLIIFPNVLNQKREMILELKKPNKIEKKYRGKGAIWAEIGNALSQLIHYIEATSKPRQKAEGILITGRENPSNFISLFNQYLHGIEIKTYRELIEDCKAVISRFKPTEELNSEAEDKNQLSDNALNINIPSPENRLGETDSSKEH